MRDELIKRAPLVLCVDHFASVLYAVLKVMEAVEKSFR